MRFLFPILFLLINPITAADSTDNLPQIVKVSLADYAAEKEKIELQAQDALSAEHKKLIAQLQMALTTETQQGNLDTALAIRNLIQDLNQNSDLSSEVPEKSSVQMIFASDFSAKTGNVEIGGAHPGLVWTNGNGGSYQYNIDVPSNNTYYLYVLMTAAESRPCLLYFDDKKVDTICSQITGTWSVKDVEWFKYGPYRLTKGSHAMRVVPVKASPHFKGYALTTNSNLHLGKTAFGE